MKHLLDGVDAIIPIDVWGGVGMRSSGSIAASLYTRWSSWWRPLIRELAIEVV